MPTLAKREEGDESNGKKRKIGLRSFVIILLLHLLLWLSVAAIAAAALMLRDPADSTVSGSAIIVLISASASVLYVLIHTHFSVQRRLGKVDDPAKPTFKQPIYMGVRLCGLVGLLWLICSGWAIIVTVKSPVCSLQSDGAVLVSCACQKAGTALSVVLLISSSILFALVQSTQNPFDNSLFGKVDFEPAYENEEDYPPYNSIPPMQRSLHHAPSYSSFQQGYQQSSSSNSVYKGKQPTPSMAELARSGIKPPGSGYFASRSNVSLVDSHRIVQSASCSSLNLAHPRPLRHIPSASNLMRSNDGSRIGYHYRAPSSSSVYSSRPSSRASSFTDLPAYVSAVSSVTVPAPSAWKAIHPPSHHLYHSSSMHSLRSMTSSSTASLSMIHQHGTRARTSPSSSSSSRGSPHAASWAHYRMHRTMSSQSSATSGSSRLGVVEEEDRQPAPKATNSDKSVPQRQQQVSPSDERPSSGKGKQPRYHLPSTPSPARVASPAPSPHSSSQRKTQEPQQRRERSQFGSQGSSPGRYKKVTQAQAGGDTPRKENIKENVSQVSQKAAEKSKVPDRYAGKKKKANA